MCETEFPQLSWEKCFEKKIDFKIAFQTRRSGETMEDRMVRDGEYTGKKSERYSGAVPVITLGQEQRGLTGCSRRVIRSDAIAASPFA